MQSFSLAERTWKEVASLAGRRIVGILPIGAVEAHGPHLPLATDGIISEAMALAGARRLEAGGFAPLVLPRLDYTAAPFAAGFPGTLSIRPQTVTMLVEDIAGALAAQGAEILALANSHLDPVHLESLREAERRVRAAGAIRLAFPDLTRKPWAPRLTDEFRSGACHAGRFEGSIVMAAQPDLVRDEVRRDLPDNPVSIGRAIREGKRTFEEAGGPEGYFGEPAAATADEGRDTIEVLGAILEEAVTACLEEDRDDG
jgi:creatinine amidohydrolase